MFNFIKKLLGFGSSANLRQLIADGAFLVDVRTPGEFAQGHVQGSVNIPLNTVGAQLNKFQNKKHIIVFCQSGMRSSQAKSILTQNGIVNVTNGGGWQSVNQIVQQNRNK